MSKSLGNVVDPRAVIEGGKDAKRDPAYGADVLRLWVASADYSSDVMIGPGALGTLPLLASACQEAGPKAGRACMGTSEWQLLANRGTWCLTSLALLATLPAMPVAGYVPRDLPCLGR